jgi:hypothetical protein
MHTTRTPGRRARRLPTLAAAMAVTTILALPAGATVDQNPGAIPFGPSVCDDGRQVALAYTPNDKAPVGFDAATKSMGVNHRLAVILPLTADPLGDHLELDVIYDRPGKGLDKNLVRCVFPFEDPGFEDAGLWLAVEINFND